MSTASPVQSCADVEADVADAAYRTSVDERLRSAAALGVTDFARLLEAADGADPRLVAQRLRALELLVRERGSSGEASSCRWEPELHALDFEWYFEPSCAAALASRVAGDGRSVLCLGTPTVAFALLDQPRLHRVTLVDANPLAVQRWPRCGDLLRSIHDDLSAARIEAGRYDAVVFDAPWYPAELQRWLAVAARAVRFGGRIVFALPRSLHRPTAAADRRLVLEAARRLGSVRVEPGALRYDTPRFEHEALATAGVTVPPAWRRADRVELIRNEAPVPVPEPPSRGRWQRFVLGSQVVKLALDAPDEAGAMLSPLSDAPDFRYASISTRDPQRASIGLWTSRSRVARVRRPALVARVLERLAQAGELRALDGIAELSVVGPGERMRLLQALRALGLLTPGTPQRRACSEPSMR